jgi:pimeloyl-ACP methyl ester carboxylesterase
MMLALRAADVPATPTIRPVVVRPVGTFALQLDKVSGRSLEHASPELCVLEHRPWHDLRTAQALPRKGIAMSQDKTRVASSAASAFGIALLAASGCTSAVSAPSTSDPPTASPRVDEGAIRPFQFHAPDDALADLRRRIAATKWPSSETVTDGSQGVQLATMRELARYWETDYDWRKVEARLNALPQFVTNIDGLDIHFIHVRSKNPHALPIIITHGWPGSIIEQLKVIEPLTNPVAYGGRAEDAFDVVIPSLPGHGFSAKPTAPGWDPAHIARAWIVLMKRLGYKRFVAQGGDWGNAVTEQMAVIAPPELLGIHTNMPATVPDDVANALLANSTPPEMTAEERHAYEQLDFFYRKGLGYAQEMSQRPQTLYGIDDSPIGLAAWMLDHDARSYEMIARAFNGHQEGLSRDDVLDNITLYWLTNTGVSAARLYWDTAHEVPLRKLSFFTPTRIKIPVAVTAFPDELYQAPRSWTERAYSKLIYFHKVDKGGHFAAWEQPQLFSAEMRAAFHSLR